MASILHVMNYDVCSSLKSVHEEKIESSLKEMNIGTIPMCTVKCLFLIHLQSLPKTGKKFLTTK